MTYRVQPTLIAKLTSVVALALFGGSGCSRAPQPTSVAQPTKTPAPMIGDVPESPNKGLEAETQFVDAYKTAHRKGDVEAALKLVYPKGVDAQGREGFKRVFAQDFKRPLVSVQLLGVENSGPEETKSASGSVHPNVKPTKILEVILGKPKASGGATTTRAWPVGEVNGMYYFAATVATTSP